MNWENDEWEDEDMYIPDNELPEFMNMESTFNRNDVWIMIQNMEKKDFEWIKGKINEK